jgi:hypothetical protein
MHWRARSAPTLLALVALVMSVGPLAACATRTIDDKVIDRTGLEVFLRHRREKGVDLDRGFAHPKEISSRRLAHILSALDVEMSRRKGALSLKKVEERRAAVDEELLDPVAGALSEAFGLANSTQEIVVRAVHRDRRFLLFTRKFVTSFIAFMQDDELHLDFSLVHWEVPKAEEENLPMPHRGDQAMKFRLIPSEAMRSAGLQAVAVSWSDPFFDRPRTMRRTSSGEAERRTVIMDDHAATPEADEATELPPGLSADTLRELAELEEARQQGEITESYYQREREKLLERAGSP